jgi:PAS domain S-box-containing protein
MISIRKIPQLSFLILLVCCAWPVQAAARGPEGTIRVGIFPFEPFNFIDSQGVAQGLYPDLLREIVVDEPWKIEFIPGSWAEGMERLQKQEIDLMVSVAFSSERAAIMDYTYESVVELWGQVFVRPEGQSYNITDLLGRKVAVMRKDISGSNFIETAKKLGVVCEIIEFATHAEVFAAVEKGDADAGVGPQHFGLRHARQYNLVGSSILFSPFSIYFASKKGTQHELLSHIDAHLSKWKRDKDSFYYQSLNRWLGSLVPRHKIPVWLTYSLIAAVSSALLCSLFVLLLRRSVRRKTVELRASERRFRDIALSMSDWIWEVDLQGNYTFCSDHVKELLGYSPEEVVGKKPFDFMPPGQAKLAKQFFAQYAEQKVPFREFEKWGLRKDGERICLLTSGVPIFGVKGELVGYRGIDSDITERKRKEGALRESEAKFRSLTESSSDYIMRYDRHGCHRYINPAGLAVLGMTEEDIIGKSHRESGFNEQQSAIWENKITMVFETGEACRLDFAWNSPTGPVCLDCRLTPEYDNNGRVISVLGVSRDVTERKYLEKIQIFLADTSAGSGEKSFFYALARFLAENLDMDFVCIDRLEGDGLTARTVAVWCDGHFEDNVSYALKDTPCGEVVGQTICCYPATVSQFFPHDQILRELRAESYVGVTVFSHTGQPIGLIAVIGRQPLNNRHFAETTLKMVAVRTAGEMERLDAEIALRKSEEQYRRIVDTAQEGIWGVDAMLRTTFVNPRMTAMLGYEADKMMGQTLATYFFDIEDLPDHFQRMQKRQQGQEDHYERKFRHKDGHCVWTSVSATAMMDSEGVFCGAFAMVTDITERRRAEEENKNLATQLQQAQKMEAIGTLAGGIAHDFNNILGAIIGYAEMIRDDCPADSTIVDDINQVLMAGSRAKELVKQILAFSRQAEAHRIPLQPASIVKEAVKLLRSSLPTTISIEQDIDHEAGVILADPTQLHQILMNLCTNAFHAMELNGGTLSIALHKKIVSKEESTLHPHKQPGDFVQLSIKDTGTGIMPEIVEKIFDPYFTTKEVGKGTGMGLSMVHGIVKSYGGDIYCESRLGEGTEFCIMFPTLDAHANQNRRNGSENIVVMGGNEHILLLDDEDFLVELGKTLFERLGYRVTTYTNSFEALTAFQNQPGQFDLVITDQTMPGMTGVDLSRRLLQIRPDIPIILCTGYSSHISEEKAKSFGIKGFAMKPLAKKDIGNLVRVILDGKTS